MTPPTRPSTTSSAVRCAASGRSPWRGSPGQGAATRSRPTSRSRRCPARRRNIVCCNPLEAKQDAADRAALLAKLRQTLEHDGPKAVVGNRGHARFLQIAKGSVTLNEAAIAREAGIDGKFVLTTSTALPAAEVARAYKSLWRVERAFRTLKSTLEVRPIFHQRDDSVIGHITGCFLALRLKVDLQQRLDAKNLAVPWPDLMRDLGQLQAVTVDLDGTRYRLRTDCVGHALPV